MKTCRACGLEKELEKFSRDKRNSDGRTGTCQACVSARYLQRYHALRRAAGKPPRAKGSNRKEVLARYYVRNKEKHKEWREENRDRCRAIRKKYNEKRRATVGGRLHDAISANLRHSLKRRKGGRKTEAMVGWSISSLISHLEKQFQRGMSWSNFGEWEIDHIRPLVSFGQDDVKDAWSLTNLRPLWKRENREKSGRRIFLI